MRRAQSLRNHTSAHHRTTSSPNADDLGILREQPEDSVEDKLRKQLLECERDKDKLHDQILALQDQLNLRPPIERIQALQREYKNLEILLQATQRENEKCMAELERGKNREKMLERELARLAGDNWQTTLNIPANTSAIYLPSTSANAPDSPDSSRFFSSKPNMSSDRVNTSNSAFNSNTSASQAHVSDAELLAHIQQVRTLLLGIEQNNEARETRLEKMLEKAEEQTERFEQVKREADGQVLTA